jgi:DNA-binding IclR family transcriptional regulator
MLRRLEALLGQRRNWSLQELAMEVGAPPELVRAALTQLERLGRLTAGPAAVRPRACLGCPFGPGCHAPRPAPRRTCS